MTKKRRCLWPPGCITILSTYNPSNFCQTHQNAQARQELEKENLKNLILVEEQQKKRGLVIAVKEKPDNFGTRRRKLTADIIMEAICQACAIKREELLNNCRKARFLVPRQIAVFLLRLDLKESFSEIAKKLGRENRISTVYGSFRKIKKLAAQNQNYIEEINKIRAYYLAKPS